MKNSFQVIERLINSCADASGAALRPQLADVIAARAVLPAAEKERAAMLEALKSAALATCQIRLAADIGKTTLKRKIAWYEGQLKQLGEEIRSAINKAAGN